MLWSKDNRRVNQKHIAVNCEKSYKNIPEVMYVKTLLGRTDWYYSLSSLSVLQQVNIHERGEDSKNQFDQHSPGFPTLLYVIFGRKILKKCNEANLSLKPRKRAMWIHVFHTHLYWAYTCNAPVEIKLTIAAMWISIRVNWIPNLSCCSLQILLEFGFIWTIKIRQ